MPKQLVLNYSANTTTHQGNVSLEENKMKCVFENKAKIALYKIKVDDGLVASSDHEKCDYLIHWEKNFQKTVFYVELKGSDIKKAFSQLINTYRFTKAKFEQFHEKHLVIVCSRYPKEDSTTRRIRIDAKKMGFNYHPSSRKFKYIIT